MIMHSINNDMLGTLTPPHNPHHFISFMAGLVTNLLVVYCVYTCVSPSSTRNRRYRGIRYRYGYGYRLPASL